MWNVTCFVLPLVVWPTGIVTEGPKVYLEVISAIARYYKNRLCWENYRLNGELHHWSRWIISRGKNLRLEEEKMVIQYDNVMTQQT